MAEDDMITKEDFVNVTKFHVILNLLADYGEIIKEQENLLMYKFP